MRDDAQAVPVAPPGPQGGWLPLTVVALLVTQPFGTSPACPTSRSDRCPTQVPSQMDTCLSGHLRGCFWGS